MRIFVFVLTLIFFLGVVIVPFEIDAPNRQIKNAFDGIWWATSTVTTAGYGGIVPVTNGGRVVGMLLQLTGAVLFGALVGTITVYLSHVQEDYRWKRLHEKLDRMEKDHQDLDKKIDFLLKNKTPASRKPRQWGL